MRILHYIDYCVFDEGKTFTLISSLKLFAFDLVIFVGLNASFCSCLFFSFVENMLGILNVYIPSINVVMVIKMFEDVKKIIVGLIE